jgi:putative restriction endonuclease
MMAPRLGLGLEHGLGTPGRATLDHFNAKGGRPRHLRRRTTLTPDPVIGAVLLTQPFFFTDDEFIPAPADWHPDIVVGKGYDLSTGVGASVWSAVLERLQLRRAADVPPPDADRETRRGRVGQRLGQGTFRSRVTDAYGRRCAVTGERTLPERPDERPSRAFLEHHRSAIFRP